MKIEASNLTLQAVTIISSYIKQNLSKNLTKAKHANSTLTYKMGRCNSYNVSQLGDRYLRLLTVNGFISDSNFVRTEKSTGRNNCYQAP